MTTVTVTSWPPTTPINFSSVSLWTAELPGEFHTYLHKVKIKLLTLVSHNALRGGSLAFHKSFSRADLCVAQCSVCLLCKTTAYIVEIFVNSSVNL